AFDGEPRVVREELAAFDVPDLIQYDVANPERQAIDHDEVARPAVLAHGPRELFGLLDRAPFGRARRAIAGDARGHLALSCHRRRQEDHRLAGRPRKSLGKIALPAARPPEDHRHHVAHLPSTFSAEAAPSPPAPSPTWERGRDAAAAGGALLPS